MGWVKGGVLLSADVKNKNSFDRLPTILFRGPHNETSPRLVIGKLYRLILYTVDTVSLCYYNSLDQSHGKMLSFEAKKFIEV